MKKARFTETQILRVLKVVEGDRHMKDVCRENGVSEASYYNWKSKYGGMESSDIKRMKELEEENRRLKQMYASGDDSNLLIVFYVQIMPDNLVMQFHRF